MHIPNDRHQPIRPRCRHLNPRIKATGERGFLWNHAVKNKPWTSLRTHRFFHVHRKQHYPKVGQVGRGTNPWDQFWKSSKRHNKRGYFPRTKRNVTHQPKRCVLMLCRVCVCVCVRVFSTSFPHTAKNTNAQRAPKHQKQPILHLKLGDSAMSCRTVEPVDETVCFVCVFKSHPFDKKCLFKLANYLSL